MMRPTKDSTSPFYPGVEGLRGIAVVVVLLFHDGASWMQGGFLGVSTFFTLSGFLITGLLVSEYERTGHLDVVRFWGRRFRRLMPAAVLTLVGIAAFGFLAADAAQHERLFGDGLSALLYVANWRLIATNVGYADLMGSPSPIQHFWSLAIEEQYYVFYPIMAAAGLVLARLPRRALGSILAVLMVAAWVWMAWLADGNTSNARIYYGTDTRSAELLAGGILALALAGKRIPESRQSIVSWSGVVGFAVCAWFWATSSTEHEFLYTGGFVLYTAASVAVIAAATLSTGLVHAILSVRTLRWIGRISYGIYLIHWPIYLWLDAERTGLNGLELTLLRLGVTTLGAAASYHWLEEPIRRGRRILGWRRWVVPPVSAITVAGAFAAASGWTLQAPEATPSSDAAIVASLPGDPHARAPGVPIRVLVVGDSISGNIAMGLTRWANETGQAKIANHARLGCGIARGGHIGEQMRSKRICDDWQAGFARPILKYHPDFIVVYSAGFDLLDRQLDSWDTPRAIGDNDYDRWLRSEYEAAIELFSQSGAHVVWISPLCLGRKPYPGGGGALDPERTRLLTENIVRPLAREFENVTYADLYTLVCPEGHFTNELAGISDFRPDGIHFSRAGARWVGTWLGRQLLRIADREQPHSSSDSR